MSTRLPSTRPTTESGDAGVATVWAAVAVTAVLGLLLVGLDLGSVIAARHRAEAAADLAALAAAGHAVHGEVPACARARRVVEQMGGRTSVCHLSGWDALVEVEIGVQSTTVAVGAAVGRARAGPAPSGPLTRMSGAAR
ncbi:MAG: Rv3654c family TadE-like protein [Pseudonocardia sp.]